MVLECVRMQRRVHSTLLIVQAVRAKPTRGARARGESERISSVARALQGARRKGRAGRWQMERLLGAALSSDAPGAGRSEAEARVRCARRQKRKEYRYELKGVLASTLYPEEAAALAFFRVPGYHLPIAAPRKGHMYFTGADVPAEPK